MRARKTRRETAAGFFVELRPEVLYTRVLKVSKGEPDSAEVMVALTLTLV